MYMKLFFLLHLFSHWTNASRDHTFAAQNGDSHVFVFDDLINSRLGNTFRNYLVGYIKYSYMYADPYENDPIIPNDGNLHWKAIMSPSKLIKMRFWNPIKEAYRSLPEHIVQGKRFVPYEVYGTLLQRGHVPIAFTGDTDTADKIFIRLFLTSNLDKHAYSDQSFYDNEDEIFASVYPKAFRIIAWTGNASTLIRPPSMGFEQTEYSLLIKLTSDLDLFSKGCEEFDERHKRRVEYSKEPFPLKNNINNVIDFDNFNVSEHLVGKYYDRNGEVIAFFDNVFPKHVVDAVRTYYTHFETNFASNLYDPGTLEQHDNVQWIMQFNPEVVLNTPYWRMILKLSEYLNNSTKWAPYDVACNLIQHTHHTRIHIDCVHNEYEYTFLMYLNPDWEADKYAETSFYQFDEATMQSKQSIEEMEVSGKLEYDLIAAVIPKFGRVALFRNIIPHSARPPAPNFLAARYTFPIKVSESMSQSRAKILHEALDYKTEDVPEHPLYKELREANYEPFLQESTQQWLQEHIEVMRQAKKKSIEQRKEILENILIPKKFQQSA